MRATATRVDTRLRSRVAMFKLCKAPVSARRRGHRFSSSRVSASTIHPSRGCGNKAEITLKGLQKTEHYNVGSFSTAKSPVLSGTYSEGELPTSVGLYDTDGCAISITSFKTAVTRHVLSWALVFQSFKLVSTECITQFLFHSSSTTMT